MHFSTASFLAVLTASTASAQQMQINYYSDQCSSYLGPVEVTWATNLYSGPPNCYNYHYGSYANIANCWAGGCVCDFYQGANCGGGQLFQQAFEGGNCVQVDGAYSFACPHWHVRRAGVLGGGTGANY
jgi:hypothetical protein